MPKEYQALAAAELALAVIVQAATPRYRDRLGRGAGASREAFAESAFVGLVCAVYDIDEKSVREKIRETAKRLETYGRKAKSEDGEAACIAVSKAHVEGSNDRSGLRTRVSRSTIKDSS